MHVFIWFVQFFLNPDLEKKILRKVPFFLMDFQKKMGDYFIPKPILNVLREVSLIDDFVRKSEILDFYGHLMEEEMRKIESFKRELPQCMDLVKDAIEMLKKESLQWRAKIGRITEEFIPLKGGDSEMNGGVEESIDINDKMNWLSSVQLWQTPVQYENNFGTITTTTNHNSVFHLGSVKYEEGEGIGSKSQFEKMGGAFSPFKKQKIMEKNKGVLPVVGLSLSIPVAEVEMESVDLNVKEDCGFIRQQLHQKPLERKNRRCWSPDLHRKFVDALNQLGGANSATPKLIREFMKVTDLTNDEVKSHLQKFRLHLKKFPNLSSAPSSLPWLTKNRYGNLSGPMVSHSTSPQESFGIGRSTKGGGSTTGGESMEDEKSESAYSWKSRFEKCA